MLNFSSTTSVFLRKLDDLDQTFHLCVDFAQIKIIVNLDTSQIVELVKLMKYCRCPFHVILRWMTLKVPSKAVSCWRLSRRLLNNASNPVPQSPPFCIELQSYSSTFTSQSFSFSFLHLEGSPLSLDQLVLLMIQGHFLWLYRVDMCLYQPM